MTITIPVIGPVPQRQHEDDAGADLAAGHDAIIPVGGRATVGTGLSLRLPDGYCAEIVSRSGLASRSGVFVLNAPGIIDQGFRGEIKVVLQNLGGEPYMVRKGDRIAQIMFRRVDPVEFVEVESFLDSTERGASGFGSTGILGVAA